ncbi:MAG: calcium-binding protein [Pseudomonadota bacterium]
MMDRNCKTTIAAKSTPKLAMLPGLIVALLASDPSIAQDGAISARWNEGELVITGTNRDDQITVAAEDGVIYVNSGLVEVAGGLPLLAETSLIKVAGLGGDDLIALNEWQAHLPDSELDGGDGNDILFSGAGNDVLIGGAGGDYLAGNAGNDTVEGQDGSDLLIVNNGDGSDFLEGGKGDDTLQIQGRLSERDEIELRSDGSVIFVSDALPAGLDSSVQTIETVRVNGRGGDDRISAELLAADVAQLELDGGEGNDLLIGGDGVDVLRGGAGNDTLLGNRGNDIVLGQDGNDLLIVNNGDGSDFLEGGPGDDLAQLFGADDGADDIQIVPAKNRVRIEGTAPANFTIDLSEVETLDVNGQGGSDVIIGSVGLNGLVSLNLDGGEGNDLLIGGDGADVLNGGPGRRDLCERNGGSDRLISCEKVQ